jgi:hypothetical protein
MGLHPNITIYGWLKPTIEVELVEGGSLLANTTYYVAGNMGFCPRTYNSVGSVPSDVHEITTTGTHKSIKITQKTYRDVQSFGDNGDGRTLVNCERHCVTDGTYADEVKFSDGSYTGTFVVDEWVDYNSFIIDTPFVDSSSTTFYTDSVRYNRPAFNVSRPTAHGMSYYIATFEPNWKGNVWTRAAYQYEGIDNPWTQTTQPNDSYGDYNQVSEISGLGTGMFETLLGYGTPYCYVDGEVTASEIQQEFVDAGFPYHCSYSEQGYTANPLFTIMAAIWFGQGSSFTLNNAVVIFGAEVWASVSDESNFQCLFPECPNKYIHRILYF